MYLESSSGSSRGRGRGVGSSEGSRGRQRPPSASSYALRDVEQRRQEKRDLNPRRQQMDSFTKMYVYFYHQFLIKFNS